MTGLITLANSWPRERMTGLYPARDCVFVGARKTFISLVDAIWAVVSYVLADVADKAVVYA